MAFISSTPITLSAFTTYTSTISHPSSSFSSSSSSYPRMCQSQQQQSSNSNNFSRRALLKTSAAILFSSTTTLFNQSTTLPANAANGTGLERAFSKVLFPKEGFNAPDTGAPPSVDKSILATAEAKAALDKLRRYEANISDLYAKFKQSPETIELTKTVRGMVSISDLRNALNVVNEAIDENAQVETDKVVRGIIQDIGELENAAVLKQGSTRTPKKITRTTDWFDKLEKDFQRLLSFYV